ncbi:MAG: glycosyltransferase family 4 protein [Pelagimonas sp.]|jgi:glycosyltransferase involved in cell wall biosynthesis|nr:glycosyltransferase family 4 protein [Pelagimonas sp.]
MATTTNNPTRLLDLTRLIRRVGRPMTGVDRVEFAYLEKLSRLGNCFGLLRSSLGYVLLDTEGCRQLAQRLGTDEWGAADRLSRVKRGLDPMRARAEADLRRLALDRCMPLRLSRMLARHLPMGVHYLNVGHSNLTNRVIGSLRARKPKIAVMIHDTIPLDFPQFQRPETQSKFHGFLTRAGRHADLILCNSEQTKADVQRHLGPGCPTLLTSHLGVNIPPSGHPNPWPRPFFLALGTIEPRKNHGFLLDLWTQFNGADLVIIGARGWQNSEVFERLDAGQPGVYELGTLPDDQVFAYLEHAQALLFPSHAEGYGLPPIEAAALGTPILCNDLPIYREVMGDIPICEKITNQYEWLMKLRGLMVTRDTGSVAASGPHPYQPPTWDSHFKAVLTQI